MEEQIRAELLAPCGNFDCAAAAVNAGADAVYLGGQLFNARAYASNFDDAVLEKTVDLCRLSGVKVYVTVNTLYKDSEFQELMPFIGRLYTMGVDGLIMQDLGAVSLVRRYLPDFPIHASTQLTANCIDDVRMLEGLGLSTVVLSRELDLEEIRGIAANTGVRIETFIHGALCVSYSGQCLMSSVLGNRSGNRGKCAQNCRLDYELLNEGRTAARGHLLSTKDICTLPLLPELLDAGVASLKIEGRMKTPEYVAGVTGIYRKYLDLYYAHGPYTIDPKDMDDLRQLFNRGSFSTGYLKTHSGLSMMCPVHPRAWGVRAGSVLSYDAKKHSAVIRTDREMVPGDGIEIRTDLEEGVGCYVGQSCLPGQNLTVRIDGPVRKNQEVWQTFDKRLMDGLKLQYGEIHRKLPVAVSVCLHRDRDSVLTMSGGGQEVRVTGEMPGEAKTQPLTREAVISQLSRLGGTFCRLESIDVDMDEGLFLNKAALNALKNQAAAQLSRLIIESGKRKPVDIRPEMPADGAGASEKSLSVCVRTRDQFSAAVSAPSVSIISLEMVPPLMDDLEALISTAHSKNKKIAVRLPRIWRGYIQDNSAGWLEHCRKSALDGWLISSPGHYQCIKDSGKAVHIDFTGNILNSYTAAFWLDAGAESAAVSVEMSRDEINCLAGRSRAELLAYGYLPLMVTHQCPVGNFAGKKEDHIHCERYGHRESYSLRSGKEEFLLDTDCRNCVCTITSDKPLDIGEEIRDFDVPVFRLNFTRESGPETGAVLRRYERILHSGAPSGKSRKTIYGKSVL